MAYRLQLLTLCRWKAYVILEELASSSPCLNPVRHRFAHLPYTKVEQLGDRKGTDHHLDGNTSQRGGTKR